MPGAIGDAEGAKKVFVQGFDYLCFASGYGSKAVPEKVVSPEQKSFTCERRRVVSAVGF